METASRHQDCESWSIGKSEERANRDFRLVTLGLYERTDFDHLGPHGMSFCVRKSRSGDDLRIRIASKSDTDNFEPSFELDILDTSDEMPPRHEQLEPALGVSRRGTGSQACLGGEYHKTSTESVVRLSVPYVRL
jgi:hypothetical protein